MPSNLEIRLLYHENDSPMTEMWPDRLYADIMKARVESVVDQIIKGSVVKSNGLNIFAYHGDEASLPMNVSYPPTSLAKQLARDYQIWIDDLKAGVKDPETLIRSYTFKFKKRTQQPVTIHDTGERIPTATVIFSYLTDVRQILR